MEENYENNLYGKIEFLHERSNRDHNSLVVFSDIITKFINSITEFSKSLDSITSRKSRIILDKSTSIYRLTHLFKLNIKTHIEEFKECSYHLNSNILGPIIQSIDEKYLKEKELYINYNKIKGVYNTSKITLEKSKKEFETNANLCEKNILSFLQLKSYDINNSNEYLKYEEKMKLSISNAKNFEDKYYQCLEEANKARKIEIKKHKELLRYYQELEKDFYSRINCMISYFIPMLKKMYNTILKSLEGVEEQCKKVNIKQDIKLLIEKYKSNESPEEELKFIPYYPEVSLENPVITGNEKKDLDILDINYNALLILYENFRDIRKDINMEEEKKKYKLRILSSKIFKIGPGVDFKQEEKNELISLLKEKSYKSYFLATLSKQRTKGRYRRSLSLLKNLSEIIKYILEDSKKTNDYDAAKNCIILSQTFYFERQFGKELKKKYLFDYIKNNEWINSIDFWVKLTENMIESEINNSEKIAKKQKTKESSEQRKIRIDNIVFSQIISYTSLMIEFSIQKEEIIKVADFYIKKHNIDKSLSDLLIESINSIPYPKNEEDDFDFEDENIKPMLRKNKTVMIRGSENIAKYLENTDKNKIENEKDKSKDKFDNKEDKKGNEKENKEKIIDKENNDNKKDKDKNNNDDNKIKDKNITNKKDDKTEEEKKSINKNDGKNEDLKGVNEIEGIIDKDSEISNKLKDKEQIKNKFPGNIKNEE